MKSLSVCLFFMHKVELWKTKYHERNYFETSATKKSHCPEIKICRVTIKESQTNQEKLHNIAFLLFHMFWGFQANQVKIVRYFHSIVSFHSIKREVKNILSPSKAFLQFKLSLNIIQWGWTGPSFFSRKTTTSS